MIRKGRLHYVSRPGERRWGGRENNRGRGRERETERDEREGVKEKKSRRQREGQEKDRKRRTVREGGGSRDRRAASCTNINEPYHTYA